MTSGLVALALLAAGHEHVATPYLIRGNPQGPVHCVARLAAELAQVRPGQPFYAAIRLMPDAGWHTYWQNPGDSGMATSVQWTLPKGWKAGPIEWPVPEVLTGPSGTNYCYPKEVLLPELVTPPADASLGQQITLKAKVGWLVCNEVCVAGNADLTLDLTIGVNNVANHDSAPRLRAVVAALPKPPKTPLRAWRKASSVILDLGSNAPSSGTAFFSSDAAIDPVQPVIVASKGGDHELRLKISPYAPPRLNRLRGILVAPRGRTLSNGSRAILVDIPINSGGSR